MSLKSILVSALFVLDSNYSETVVVQSCAYIIPAAKFVWRLTDLDQDIRDHLNIVAQGEMGERDSPLLQTDAPTDAEKEHRKARFVQAMLVNEEWFVQFEVATFSGVRTIGYVRDGNGRFRPLPTHYFGGPPCESIQAALDGVTTPGGFNF